MVSDRQSYCLVFHFKMKGLPIGSWNEYRLEQVSCGIPLANLPLMSSTIRLLGTSLCSMEIHICHFAPSDFKVVFLSQRRHFDFPRYLGFSMSIPIFREVEGLSKHVSISGQASA
jgi:hypothetical protein